LPGEDDRDQDFGYHPEIDAEDDIFATDTGIGINGSCELVVFAGLVADANADADNATFGSILANDLVTNGSGVSQTALDLKNGQVNSVIVDMDPSTVAIDSVVYTDVNGQVLPGATSGAFEWRYYVTGQTVVDTRGASTVVPDHSLVMTPQNLNPAPQTETQNCAGANGNQLSTTPFAVPYIIYEAVDADGDGTPEVVTQFADPATIQYIHTVLPVSISFVTSDLAVSGNTTISWKTTQETGTIGFMLYQKTESGWETLGDGELIGTGAIDSFETNDYTSSVYNLKGDWFAIADVDTQEVVTLHGPYKVGNSYGEDEADIKVEAVDWSLIKRSKKLDVNAIQDRIKRLKGGQ